MRSHTDRRRKYGRIIGLAVLAVTSASVLQAATAVATASAEIVYPIAVSTISNLSFGRIAQNDAGGSVTITANGERVAANGTEIVTGSPYAAAEFIVTGEPGATYAVTLPASTTISRGTDHMVIDQFTATATTGILQGGEQKLAVGATLHLQPNQPLGSYAGSFTVMVAYN